MLPKVRNVGQIELIVAVGDVFRERGVAAARERLDRLDQEAQSLLRRNNHTQDVGGAVRIAEQSQATTLLGWSS